MIYPNHPKFITVAEFDTHGRYINVAHAFLSTNSTVDAPSYNIGTRQTPQLVPHLAPQGKDWLWIGDTWQLHDDFKDVDVYDKRTAMRTEPPIFGQPLADHMTLKAPPHETGKVTYWDSKAIDWAQRTDHTGIQCWSTVDPRQSMVLSVDDLDIPEGYTTKPQPTPAHDWDAKKQDWVLDKTKQAELDKQVLDSADAQLTCLMSQMCAWLTIESYKPKTDQRGGNILSPVKIDEMLQDLPSSVETDLMRNAWSRATRIEFTSATTQSFAQILDMSKDQLRIAMTEAKAL